MIVELLRNLSHGSFTSGVAYRASRLLVLDKHAVIPEMTLLWIAMMSRGPAGL